MFKEQLIVLIAKNLSEETCGRIIARIGESYLANQFITTNRENNKNFYLANSENWDENEHPRANDGKFTKKGTGTVTSPKADKAPEGWHGETPAEAERSLERSYTEQFKKAVASRYGYDWLENNLKFIDELYDDYANKRYSEDDVIEFLENDIGLEDSKKNVRELAVNILKSKIKQKKIRSVDQELSRQKRRSMMEERVKRFHEIEDDLDAIEETYGQNPAGGELEFPTDKQGKADKRRYETLKRQKDALEKKIDWDME